MKIFKLLFGLVSWAALWMLFAKKTWKDLRKSLHGKSTEAKAKILWEQLLWLWKDLFEEAKELPENEAVKKLTKIWKEKLEEIIKEVKENWNEMLEEILPKLEKAAKEAQVTATKKVATVKKAATKKVWEVKKAAAKKAKTVRKTVEKKVNEVVKKVTK